MKYLFLVFLLTGVCGGVSAQHENDNWYFGSHAAVSFLSGAPVNLPNGALDTDEGCSSVSDSAGNLLFYTNGVQVWNKLNQQMPNGFALDGHISSTQSALAVRDPGNAHRYYIFTTPDWYDSTVGFRYSLVDMTLQGGLGDVSTKNVLLMTPSDEKLTATRSATGNGYWIVVHQQPHSYYAFPLTASGVGTATISNIGVTNTALSPELGTLKISPDRRWIIGCQYNLYCAEIGHFNDTTGVVSGFFLFHSLNHQMYGAEFSNSGKTLYVGGGYSFPVVFQLNVTSNDSTAITSSAQIINTSTHHGGAFQRAPNGKIYIAHRNENFLSVIDNPDSLGVACNYVDTGFVLGSGAHSIAGLPASVSYPFYLQPQAHLQPLTTKLCAGTCTGFNNTSANASSYEWFFHGANPNTSTDTFPSNICYATSGLYSVTLIAHNGPYSDTSTINNLIEVYSSPSPTITQSNDTLYCHSALTGLTYQWSLNGNPISSATNSYYVPSVNGNYSVQATSSNGCSANASLEVDHLGIAQANGDEGFSLFPNPADESFTITFHKSGKAQLRLYSALGQRCIGQSLNLGANHQQIISTSDLPNGVYMVTLQTNFGVQTSKLVVSHR